MCLGRFAVDHDSPVGVIRLGDHKPSRNGRRELVGHPLVVIHAVADEGHSTEWLTRLPLILLEQLDLVRTLCLTSEAGHVAIHTTRLNRDKILREELQRGRGHGITLLWKCHKIPSQECRIERSGIGKDGKVLVLKSHRVDRAEEVLHLLRREGILLVEQDVGDASQVQVTLQGIARGIAGSLEMAHPLELEMPA